MLFKTKMLPNEAKSGKSVLWYQPRAWSKKSLVLLPSLVSLLPCLVLLPGHAAGKAELVQR